MAIHLSHQDCEIHLANQFLQVGEALVLDGVGVLQVGDGGFQVGDDELLGSVGRILAIQSRNQLRKVIIAGSSIRLRAAACQERGKPEE